MIMTIRVRKPRADKAPIGLSLELPIMQTMAMGNKGNMIGMGKITTTLAQNSTIEGKRIMMICGERAGLACSGLPFL